MKHLMFPTVAQADAFVQDLQAQGVIRPEMGSASINRRSAMSGGTMTDSSMASTTGVAPHTDVVDGSAEDAGAGAVKGTGVGAAVGAVAGVVATIATGGLAGIPVILGMAALGSGVGAGVGAVGGAAGVDETNGMGHTYDVDDDHYERMSSTVSSGGRAVAIEDSIPHDVVAAAAARHGGQFV
ncbi:hypothetical protein [Deinococcus puniceus]|uniref:Uncharacterized protein n=1 Tax=Deinococcus puniceus TaxID=1182568 RepID=A0A172TAE8_9DEIO|nr:hypothetical protein [Deinococcus puniceus]ANE43783.1 hypothetical protein SU48_08355 [Deinococcus puniceus]